MVQHTSFRVNNRCIAGGLQSIRWKTTSSFNDPNESRNLLFALLPWGINNNNNKSSSIISHNINNNSNSSFPKSSSCQVFTYLNYDLILQHKIFCYMHKKQKCRQVYHWPTLTIQERSQQIWLQRTNLSSLIFFAFVAVCSQVIILLFFLLII